MDLKTFFQQHPKIALGFSGGVDSSYLLYAGLHYGAQVKAYYIHTAFQPQFELDDALRLAKQLGIEITVILGDILADPHVIANPSDRCYFCKQAIFGLLRKQALEDGFTEMMDGSNASDDAGDRPGMRALHEMSVYSPLRECGLTKDRIRQLSKEAGLFTWNKPAYACLATRVPTGQPYTAELLSKIENAEDALFAMGFSDFRVRVYVDAARIQLKPEQMNLALEQREKIIQSLKPYFPAIMLDLEAR